MKGNRNSWIEIEKLDEDDFTLNDTEDYLDEDEFES